MGVAEGVLGVRDDLPKRGDSVLQGRQTVTVVVAMSNGKAPTEDPVADRAFHLNLFSKFGREEFFSWLMGFFEGDGSVSISAVFFHQSALGFLQAVGDMLLQLGHAEPRIYETGRATDEPTHSSFQKTRSAYTSTLQAHEAAALAKEIYDAYVLSGLASFRKAKLLCALAHAYNDEPDDGRAFSTGPPDVAAGALATPSGEEWEVEEWEVEEIVSERRRGRNARSGVTEYLVHWAAGDKTWEPLEHVKGLEAFEAYRAARDGRMVASSLRPPSRPPRSPPPTRHRGRAHDSPEGRPPV